MSPLTTPQIRRYTRSLSDAEFVVVRRGKRFVAYQVFMKTVRRDLPATVSLGPSGRIGLNKRAAEILHDEAANFVLLLWDADAHKIAIKPTRNKKDARAYKVTFSRESGAAIAAKSFMDYIGADCSTTKRFLASWSDRECALEADLNSTLEGLQNFKIVHRRTA